VIAMLTRSRAKFRFRAILAVAAVLTVAVAAPVRAADDEEQNSGVDHDIFKGVLKNLGIYNEGNEINYRERSPLVVPPSRNLPVPVKEDATVEKNPAWPLDQDVKRKREEKKVQSARRRSFEEESKPLPPDELRGPPGRVNEGGRAKDYENPAREAPSAGQSLWNSLFNSKDEQVGTFKGEPPRASLTEPPPGYQTPSPNFPYGINTKEAPKADKKLLEIDRR